MTPIIDPVCKEDTPPDFSVTPKSLSRRSSGLIYLMWLSAVLERSTMSFIYTIAYCHLSVDNIKCIWHWNVAGTFHSPNGILIASNNPWWRIKASFFQTSSSTMICQSHCSQPIQVLLEHPSISIFIRQFLVWGRNILQWRSITSDGLHRNVVLLSIWVQTRLIKPVLSCARSIAFHFNTRYISFFFDSCTFCPAREGRECMCRMYADVIFIGWVAMLIGLKWLFLMVWNDFSISKKDVEYFLYSLGIMPSFRQSLATVPSCIIS